MRDRLHRDDHAQMMLLTAFVLVLGFVALAGMSARVTQLPDETRQALDRPVMNEAAAVVAAVEHILDRLEQEHDTTDNLTAYMASLPDALAYLEPVIAAKGFDLDIVRAECIVVADAPLDDARVEVEYRIQSVDTRASFTSQKDFLDIDCVGT